MQQGDWLALKGLNIGGQGSSGRVGRTGECSLGAAVGLQGTAFSTKDR